MDTFAFIIHPINPKRDVSRKFPLLGRILSERQINFLSTFFPPVFISEIEGITSLTTRKTIQGWFLACPLTPNRMLELPEKVVYRKIIQTGQLAEKLGAKIIGLGAFTSVIGDAGITIANSLNTPVTTGDSYTIATALKAVREAARMMDISLSNATAAVVGATGSIGSVCADFLADDVRELILIGRRDKALTSLKDKFLSRKPRAIMHTNTSMEMLQFADIIITVTSSIETIIDPKHLKPGCVVCDVARPRDVSARVAESRDDVLVIDGGMVEVPGPVKFNFDFGFPSGKAYACMAETFALALQGQFENFTLGKSITRQQVEEIDRICDKHGFQLGGFRSFEKPVSRKQIAHIKKRAGLA